MKHKKGNDGLLNPTEYWEKKLNINHKTEQIRYKKLSCKLSKKEKRLLDGAYYITFSDWEIYMQEKISVLV